MQMPGGLGEHRILPLRRLEHRMLPLRRLGHRLLPLRRLRMFRMSSARDAGSQLEAGLVLVQYRRRTSRRKIC